MSLKFILVKDKSGYDISDIVQKVVWSGRKNSPARSLQIVLLDDASLGSSNRADVDVYSGNHLIFSEDGAELFRGIIMKQVSTQEQTLTITAYDNAIYLSNNKDSFTYTKKTLTEVFVDVCSRYGISRGETAAVLYKIPTLTGRSTTIYDLLCNAMSQTYKATGERYYIVSKKGQLHLLRRRENATKYVMETGNDGSAYGNITQYSYSRDISNTKTRIKLLSSSGGVAATWSDMELEGKIGMMQDVQTPEETKNLKTLAVTMLNELKKPAESLNITALGVSSVYSGTAVYASIPDIGIGRAFYVDADTHTWDGDYHTMKLTLNFATDLESINEEGEVETATESSATAAAKQAVKDAAAALKSKKAAEAKVVKAGAAAEKYATAAEKALANAKKQKTKAKAASYAKTAITQASKALAEYEKAKTALAEAKSLVNMAQAVITTNADYAARQAELAAQRAQAASDEAQDYL